MIRFGSIASRGRRSKRAKNIHTLAGIVGNLVHESGMRPNAVGDSGTSGGLAQFHNERLANLRNYASSVGKPATDFQTQLEFRPLHLGDIHVFGAVARLPWHPGAELIERHFDCGGTISKKARPNEFHSDGKGWDNVAP
jgi:hypothetical protein